MFSIGDFARYGRISVRMLRHYDSIGLLRPASVDPLTGYRYYQAGQLSELNRIVALKELGFTLDQVRGILADEVSAAELRGMLQLRKAQIEVQIEAETTRLARVEARLLAIEDGGRTPVDGVVIKRLAPTRVAELVGTASSYQPEDITPVIQPLYADLWTSIAKADVCPTGPAVAYYEDSQVLSGSITVHAAVPVALEVGDNAGFTVLEMPEVRQAATIIHHGAMDDVLSTIQALARWIDANSFQSLGYAREITIQWSPNQDEWVTELQQPLSADRNGRPQSLGE